MEVINTISALRERVDSLRSSGKRIAFVPTMGALHPGHLSLVKIAQSYGEIVVMSIFVNPLQFNSGEDLVNYPRTIERDTEMAQESGVTLLFVPSAEELYPGGPECDEGRCRLVAGSASRGLCGATRPGHFDGVVTVVSLLFHIVQPDLAVFGEKDYQQLQVIQQMVRDQHFPVQIISGPTIRESDGLAMSSRNLRLSAEERYDALFISKSLIKARELFARGERSAEKIRNMVLDGLAQAQSLKVDYVEIVNPTSLESVSAIGERAQLLVAAFVGPVRLIDNIRLGAD